MQRKIQQPATHSLLRQSQRRHQSFSRTQSNPSPINNLSHHFQKPSHQKYHYNYSRSSNFSGHKKGISSSLYESKYLSKNKLSPSFIHDSNLNNPSQELNTRHSMIVTSSQQKIVVCQSLPKSRPKYSFTFSNLPLQSSATHSITTIPNKPNPPEPARQTPRASLLHPSPPSSQRPACRSPDVRKDMDLCLYAISDKLKQLQEQQKQTKNLIESKFKNVQDTSYRPSISQIRKNKKIYIDRSIHRIHPEIVNQYIETIYRDYDIPDPLKSGNKRQREVEANVSEIAQFNIRQGENLDEKPIDNKESKKQLGAKNVIISTRQQIKVPNSYENDAQKPMTIQTQKAIAIQTQKAIETQKQKAIETQKQKAIAIQSQRPLTYPHQLPQKLIRQQYYLHNAKLPAQHNRKNNLIQSRQTQKQKIINRKKKFLGLTLSKQKPINPKTFNSPQQIQKPNTYQQHSSPSQSSKSKHSSSQKKILQIKKNIATWNDHEHHYAERYSYIESPYQMIRQSRPQHHNGNTSQHKNGQINIRIKPFEQLMKATIPTEANQPYSTNVQNTTQNSQFLQSKYVQSFFTQQGEVMEEFRFCVLCELPVLSANISKHQQKCIGWIDQKGKLVSFKDLYKIQQQDLLKEVIKGKISEIKRRTVLKITQLKERQKRDPDHKSKLTTSIMQSVQNMVQTFILMAEFDSPNPQNSSLFSSGYKKIQQNYKSEYILLLQQSKKLHWFVKLLENYQKRLEKMNTTVQGIRKQKVFTSTKAKHNQSLTFIQEESHNNQVVSEFGSQREH